MSDKEGPRTGARFGLGAMPMPPSCLLPRLRAYRIRTSPAALARVLPGARCRAHGSPLPACGERSGEGPAAVQSGRALPGPAGPLPGFARRLRWRASGPPPCLPRKRGRIWKGCNRHRLRTTTVRGRCVYAVARKRGRRFLSAGRARALRAKQGPLHGGAGSGQNGTDTKEPMSDMPLFFARARLPRLRRGRQGRGGDGTGGAADHDKT